MVKASLNILMPVPLGHNVVVLLLPSIIRAGVKNPQISEVHLSPATCVRYICVGLCMAVYGCVWLCKAMYGYEGLRRAVYGCVWLCKAKYRYVGLCMAMYGCVGLCRAEYGYVGLCRAV